MCDPGLKSDLKSTHLVFCNTPPRLLCSPEVVDSVDLQREGKMCQCIQVLNEIRNKLT